MFAAATALAAVCALSVMALAAAPGFRVDPFEPLPAQGTATLGIAGSEVLPHLTPSAGVVFHHASNLLLLRTNDEATGAPAGVERSLKSELWAAVGFFDYVDVGLVLPLVLDQGGGDLDLIGRPGSDAGGFGVGDLRVIARGRFLHPGAAAGVGGALVASLTLPTGSQGAFLSDGQVAFEPRLVFDWSHDLGFVVALNAGFVIRPEVRVHNIVAGHAFRWGLAVQTPTGVPGLRLLGTVSGTVSAVANRSAADLTADARDGLADPAEALGGLQYRYGDLVVQIGAGAGLSRAVGSPGLRVVMTVGFTPSRSPWARGGGEDDGEASQ